MRQSEFQLDVFPLLKDLAEAFEKKPPSDAVTRVWWNVLADLDTRDVIAELTGWSRTRTKFPSPAEVHAAASQRGADRRERQNAVEKAREAKEVKQLTATPEGKRAAAELKAALAKLVPQRTGKERVDRAWARKILDRMADGDAVPDISQRFAFQALAVEGEKVRATIAAARAKEG